MESHSLRLPDVYHAHDETVQAAHNNAIEMSQQPECRPDVSRAPQEPRNGEVTTRVWPEAAVRVANVLAAHPSLIHFAEDGSVIVMNYPGQFGRR